MEFDGGRLKTAAETRCKELSSGITGSDLVVANIYAAELIAAAITRLAEAVGRLEKPPDKGPDQSERITT